MAKILGLHITDTSVRALSARSSFGRIEALEYVEIPVRTRPPLGAAGVTFTDAPADTLPGVPAQDPIAAPGLDPYGQHEGAAQEEEEAPHDDPRADAIAELFASLRPPPDQIYVDFDGKDASLRTVELPSGAAKKGRLGEVLPFELDDLLPFDVDIALVDYQPISDDGDTTVVLATAVPRERIRARIEELEGLGVSPRGLPIGAAALDGLVSFVPELGVGGPHLIVEIEDENTEVCVLKDGACVFARSLSFGTKALLSSSSARSIAMLRRTLGAYRASGGAAPESAYLAGNGVDFAAQLSPLLASLGEGLFFEPVPVPAIEGASARFARAAALAGRAAVKGKRLDMRQGEFAQKRAMGELRQHARVVSIGVAAVVLSFAYATYARYSVLSSDNEALRDQLSQTTEQLFSDATSSVERARNLLERGTQVQDPLPTMDGYDVLEAITAAIPADIEHKTRRLSIEIDDEARSGRVDLQGTVLNQDSPVTLVNSIKANLEAHECTTDVDLKGTSPGPNNEGLNYRIEVDLQCPGDEPEPESSRSRRGRNR